MTEAEIAAFLGIYENNSITAAAEKLFISQSSLTTRLKTLENELNCTLFIRGRGQHEAVLTAQGEKFLELARRYRTLMAEMRSLAETTVSHLRIAAFNSLATYLLPESCERFIRLHPEITFEVLDIEKTGDMISDLRKSRLDMAFTTADIVEADLKLIPVFSEKMVCICSEETEWNENSYLDPKREIYMDWSEEFAAWHEKQFAGCRPGLRISGIEQLRVFIEHQDRWALVPESVAGGLIAAGAEIRILPTVYEIPGRRVNCLTSKNPLNKKEIDIFLKCIREHE